MKTKKIPEIGFLRLRDVIGGKDNPGIIPVSRSSWYKGIAEGRYPKPVTYGLWVAAQDRNRGPGAAFEEFQKTDPQKSSVSG